MKSKKTGLKQEACHWGNMGEGDKLVKETLENWGREKVPATEVG